DKQHRSERQHRRSQGEPPTIFEADGRAKQGVFPQRQFLTVLAKPETAIPDFFSPPKSRALGIRDTTPGIAGDNRPRATARAGAAPPPAARRAESAASERPASPGR